MPTELRLALIGCLPQRRCFPKSTSALRLDLLIVFLLGIVVGPQEIEAIRKP